MSGGILAVRQDSLGDVLLAGPALRALASGGRPLTLLCGPRGEAAARLLPAVDEVLVHLAPWIDPEPPPLRAAACHDLVEAVAARAPAEAVIFTSFHQSPLPAALLLRLAGVPRISAISVDYPGSLLDLRHRVRGDVHEVDRALSLAAAAGHRLPPDDPPRLRVRQGTPSPLPDEPFVVVHPGASVPARAWHPDAWSALVGVLCERGRRVVVTGSAAESGLTLRVAGGRRGVLDLGGCCDFGELAAVLGRAEAVAVANTGPAHLAAAVGTPVASLFAPTVPWVRWRPWGVPHERLGRPCLADVEPARVADAVERLAALGRPNQRIEALA
jgi:ADP-heptose:LPS heptosyltransferase